MSPGGKFKPPTPVGEPFRADPSDEQPFVSEGNVPPVVPAYDDSVGPWMPEGVYAHASQAPALPEKEMRPQFKAPMAPGAQSKLPPDPEAKRQDRFAKIGLSFGIVSILISPIVSPVAIAMGIISMRRGQKKIGAWALSTGIAGAVIGIVVVVLVATGVIPSLDQMIQDLRNKN